MHFRKRCDKRKKRNKPTDRKEKRDKAKWTSHSKWPEAAGKPDSPFLVVVTYGTRADSIYARVSSFAAAKRLMSLAKSLGYVDARIVRESDFTKASEEHEP